MNNKQFEIPITNNCILALNLDFERSNEHILIGELREIQRYLRGYKQAVILAEETREISAFAKECFSPYGRRDGQPSDRPFRRFRN